MSRVSRFKWQSTIAFPCEDVFAWHARPGAFERLNPPWRPVQIIRSPNSTATNSITAGSEVTIRLPLALGISIPWHLTHTAYEPPRMFRDEQLRGPFRSWRHTHSFLPELNNKTTLIDEIEYQLPKILLAGKFLANRLLHRELRRLFAFRHAALATDLALHARWQNQPRQTILIAGGSGFIGQALRAFLTTAGHSVRTLVRRTPQNSSEHFWDPAAGILSPEAFIGVTVVINLCGENIATKRWTRKQKEAIKNSRVQPTRLLAQAITTLASPPRVFISASGSGYYGDTGAISVDEAGRCGADFLAHTCARWEEAAAALSNSNCRSVQLRLGMVLNAGGGALAKILPSFILGVGGRLGSGDQYISWIGLADLLGVFEHIIFTEHLHGAVNCCAPEPCTNREFTNTLGRVLKRPTVIPVPLIAIKALFGEMSTILLSSNRLSSKKLLDSGYTFLYPDLYQCLRFECS